MALQLYTVLKMKVFVEEVNVNKSAKKEDLFTFIKKILQGKLHFLYNVGEQGKYYFNYMKRSNKIHNATFEI